MQRKRSFLAQKPSAFCAKNVAINGGVQREPSSREQEGPLAFFVSNPPTKLSGDIFVHESFSL
jgi:hypothetical protein